ncbi:MAG: hypothetical protein RIR10_215 [Planctomycetota bacterium]
MERGESLREMQLRGRVRLVTRAGAVALLALAPLLAVTGCATDEAVQAGASNQGADTQQQTSASHAEELARARAELAPLVAEQNERSARLATFESRASLEFRYRDASGEHFEQCEADIFLAPPNRGALRVMKVGTNLWWIGGDGTRCWIFELNVTPKRATVYDSSASGVFAEAGDVVGTGEFTLLSPESVRLLMGHAAIVEEWVPVALIGVATDAPLAERFGARVQLEARNEARNGSAARLFATTSFGRDRLPRAISIESSDGVKIAEATLADPVRASMTDIAQGAWPTVARRVEVVAPRSGASIKIFLDTPAASATRMKPRFFELDALLTQLRPEVVEFVTKSNAGDSSSRVPAAAPSSAPSSVSPSDDSAPRREVTP